MATLKRKAPEFADALDATPTGRPAKKLRLTQGQKQALIDNLQLEITERARKLRAQYALQANDLRARIERRVNRIPISLRKVNMGELFEKHSAPTQATSPIRRISPAKVSRAPISIDQALSPSGTRDGRNRRTSNDGHYSDKENAPAAGTPEGLKNPKRRGKAPAAGGASRVVSQEVRGHDHRILSPKSLNSRTYPQSPFRTSPEKGQPSYLSRPTSPLKPSSPLRAAGPGSRPRGATVSTVRDNQPTTHAKKTTARSATGPRAVRSPLPRPATRQGERKNSFSSTASSGTTTVTKPTRTGTGARKATAGTTAATKKPTVPRAQAASLAVKKTATAATASTVRKTTAPASTAEASTRGTRALRKRV
ncbi:uncharacterized protein N7482_008963 [Penicillium canariense]|uniref:Borealin N-terminal domain-containing protein n=1 Tax=Penicillium canariense TaxID=189055 RepID=A0A9W9HW64_9EURO|nr:uncharacterized protein N7482_008963 [Penicillium canariense]KAJ5157863.1 hypothetical protein N7482_008963 [Penicillium canariense]